MSTRATHSGPASVRPPASREEQSDRWIFSRAPLFAIAIIAVFMTLIGLRVHYTWIDEIYFAEPAINFLTGSGYTSAAWNVGFTNDMHVTTAPAYSLLLIAWLKLMGISQFAVRSLPLLLAILATVVLWRACVRAGLVRSAAAGTILICVALLSYGFAFSFTSGRPEALSALAVAAMFYLVSIPSSRTSFVAFVAIAFLLPFIQWSAVIYAFLLAAVLLFFLRGEPVRRILAGVAAVVCGLLCQYALYRWLGIWEEWLGTLSSERSLSIVQQLMSRLSIDALRAHNNTLPKDFSAFVLLGGMVLLGVATFVLRIDRHQTLLKAGLAIFAAVLGGMFMVAKFPTYYGWMLTFPLAVILAAMFDRISIDRRALRSSAVAAAVLACVVGFPVQAAVAVNDWPYRTPARVDAWLESQIRPDDTVFCDYPFYYLAKDKAQKVFVGRYGRVMASGELDDLDLVLLSKHFSDWCHPEILHARVIGQANWDPPLQGLLGNDWRYGILSAPNYRCTALRLAPSSDR